MSGTISSPSRVLACLVLASAVLSGCSGVRVTQRAKALEAGSWVLLPMLNYADVPQAGERAEALLATLLRIRGIEVAGYSGERGEFPEIDERRRQERAQEWARGQGFRYGITGSVQEWRYRVGAGGEPAVGLALWIVDLESGKVVWSAAGARAGWMRDTVAGTAQTLLEEMLLELGKR